MMVQAAGSGEVKCVKRPLLILAACFSAAFMSYGIRYAYSMLLPEIMRELNLTNAQAGLIYTTCLALYTVSSVFVGFLVDVKGIKRTTLAFLPLLGIGAALMSVAFSDWSGALFLGISGIGASVCWTPLTVWVQRVYPARRGFSLGILQLGPNVGFGTLGFVIPMLVPYVGWRGCWLILGAASLALLLPLVLLAEEPEVGDAPAKSLKEHVKGFTSILSDKRFWLGGLSYMLASFAIMVPMTFVKNYAYLELMLDRGASTALFSVIGFVGIIGTLVIPILSDKTGRRLAIALCNSITAIGLLGSALMVRQQNYIDIALWNGVVGIGYGAMWPLYAALVKDIYGWGVMGSITGLWTLLCGVGLLTSPAVGGLVADMYGSYRPTYLMGFGVTLTSIAFALSITLKRRG
ncbi:MAG: MFS transporter [Candidatus Nezhaarchaeota archaeon]|nr:MFS transporter [Candidatus Nezhaarchaeota archaeon]